MLGSKRMVKIILYMVGAGAIYYISPLWMLCYLAVPLYVLAVLENCKWN